VEEKKLAVITGASSGIGYELAKVFCKNGFDLVVAAEDTGIQTAATHLRELGTHVEAVQTDLAKLKGVDQLYLKIKELGRPVDALVLNAGVGVGGEFVDNNFIDELNIMRLNVVSPVYLTKLCLRDMLVGGKGKILFTSSVAAATPGPYEAVYAASKAFIQSFSEAIRHELKDRGITVTALQPGATDTNFFERAGMMDTKVGAGEKDDPAKVAQQGFDALMAGKDHVVAGSFMNKVEVKAADFISQPQGAKQQAKSTKPHSADKH
jgi:short-subunit dehydrogenase